jgi:hypothetical protein
MNGFTDRREQPWMRLRPQRNIADPDLEIQVVAEKIASLDAALPFQGEGAGRRLRPRR